jgi:branched-subunit amino acid aminotransferase/4-amino-4-deoxychorismate lyase
MDYILINGKIYDRKEFNPSGLFLRKGLALTDRMWFDNGEIRFFGEHMQNINAILAFFNETPVFAKAYQTELLRTLKRLINKNKAFMGGWVSILWIFESGLPEFYAEVIPSPGRVLPFESSGKLAAFAPLVKFSGNPLNRYFHFNTLFWDAERFRSRNAKTDESIFLNEKGMVTEVLGSCLFCIAGNSLITPSAETGCFTDPVRRLVLEAARRLGFRISESENISPSGLYGMDEIFTVSESLGFGWILGIETKRYMRIKTGMIREEMNRFWTGEISLETGFAENSPR